MGLSACDKVFFAHECSFIMGVHCASRVDGRNKYDYG
jgi:hypothetical protein